MQKFGWASAGERGDVTNLGEGLAELSDDVWHVGFLPDYGRPSHLLNLALSLR
jgi:hypothetical protein